MQHTLNRLLGALDISRVLDPTYVMFVEPSGVQVLNNPNPLEDVEASVVLDVVVLV